MTQRLDLLKIAQEEQDGDLFKYLDGIYKRSKIQPKGFRDAIIWEGGSQSGNVKPVAHAFTDMFALNGTLMALDVLGLPFLGVPMMAQFRHDTKLISLDWFGKLDYTALKWSTAGDFMVNENGKKKTVTRMQAMVKRIVAGALQGDQKALLTLVEILRRTGRFEQADNASLLPDDYEAVLEAYVSKRRQLGASQSNSN